MIDAIRSTLEDTPPELASDIMEKGITLTGGGSLLKDLDKLIKFETELDVTLAENPIQCVVNGTGRAIENEAIFESIVKINAES